MTGIKDLIPMSIRGLDFPKETKCGITNRELNAQSYAFSKTSKNPKEIANAIIENEGRGLSLQEIRQLPNYILHPDFKNYNPSFCKKVLKHGKNKPRFWARLFRVWVQEYQPNTQVGGMIIKALRKNRKVLKSRQRHLLNHFPSILPNNAHPTDFLEISMSILRGTIDTGAFAELGFRSGKLYTKYATVIITKLTQGISRSAPGDKDLAAFLSFISPAGALHKSCKEYAMVGLIAGAQQRPPDSPIVKSILKVIDRNFKDPTANEISWPEVHAELGGPGMRKECINTIKKWRVFKSINFFFDIIEKTVEEEDKHQFPQRRKFWLAYFDKGQVEDACIILGSAAQIEINKIVQVNEEYASLGWSKLTGGPSGQCSLLLDMGKITVMEFSHRGACRVWDHNQILAPLKLHKSKYSTDELRADCPENHKFRHDKYGKWKMGLSRLLDMKLIGRSYL